MGLALRDFSADNNRRPAAVLHIPTVSVLCGALQCIAACRSAKK
jgi:hypothetical protein